MMFSGWQTILMTTEFSPLFQDNTEVADLAGWDISSWGIRASIQTYSIFPFSQNQYDNIDSNVHYQFPLTNPLSVKYSQGDNSSFQVL